MTARKAAITYRTANLSPAEFGEAANISPTTVRALIAKGDLKATKLGRAVRIPITELDRLGLAVPSYLKEAA
ncbi:MAG: helix-turn-helix domain-containing protein [Actinomyces urogenitalis]|nr:helix-turn-helix domain-containing protein [Actinomyces urogenitalis]